MRSGIKLKARESSLSKSDMSALGQPTIAVPIGEETRVFHTLDALRGFAALSVVVFHMSGIFAPLAAPGGYLAVDLFFMMSGVVLTHAYQARFRAGMNTREFMRARLIRLYPLYFLGTLVGIAVTAASLLGRNTQGWDSSSLVPAVLLALLFLPNLSGRPVDQLFPLNIPCWSLFFEILVNLLFVLSWPLLTSRRLVAVSILTGIGVAVAIAHAGNIDQGSNISTFAVGLSRTVFGFTVGILIARHVPRLPRRQSNLRVLGILGVVAIAIIGWPSGGLRVLWDAACVLLVFPLLVCSATLVDPGPRLQRIATFLGVTSYAVYVLHSPLSSILNSVTRNFGGISAPYLGVAVLIMLLAGCWLVDRIIDMPVRRYLNRIVPKGRPAAKRA